MSITTEQINDIFFVRFTSDLIGVCDGIAMKDALQQALSTGTRKFAFSVALGSLANSRSILRLLRQCKEVIRSANGSLYFIELSNEEKSAYQSICDVMQIPLYNSEDLLFSASLSPAIA